MKHVFIINPAAGQGDTCQKLKKDIKETFPSPIIYETKCIYDGQVAAARMAEDLHGQEAIFFACGGDGTVNEVLNGIAGHPNIALGIVPIGTGNDTVRNFDLPKEAFLNMKAQMNGTLKPLDIMHYQGKIDGHQQSRYAINMFNNGFDCNVVDAAASMKELPLVSGSLAYLLAVAKMFIMKEGISLDIEADGEVLSKGNILLCAISNGCYCGGGIKSSPLSIMDDGFMDLTIIKETTRRRFLKLFPSFAKGQHLDRSDVADLISVTQCKKIKLTPHEDDSFMFCADGEIAHCESLEIQVVPQAIRLLIPSEDF